MLTVEQGNEQVLQNIIESFRGKKGITISLLSKIQDTFGYLPQEAMSKVARELDISEASLYGVATFTLCFGLTLRKIHHQALQGYGMPRSRISSHRSRGS